MLAEIKKGKSHNPPRVLIYGTEGIGKSTFAAGAPSAIFVPTESGIDNIDCDSFPLAKSFGDVMKALRSLLDEKHDYQSVVIDSLDWLEQLIWRHLCAEHDAESIEKIDGGYGKGYVFAAKLFRAFIDLLEDIRDQKKMVVILVAHAKIEKFEDPENAAYDRFSPRLHKHTNAIACEWVDAVLFANMKIRLQSEQAGFSRKRVTAHAVGGAGTQRVLRCVGGPGVVAKNRYGITEELALSWDAFCSAAFPHDEKGDGNG